MLAMHKRNRKRLIKLFIFLGILAVMVWLATRINPTLLIENVGPRNVYIILFFISLVSAVSTLTAAPFYIALIVAITGGLNPIIVALVVSPAIVIGDLVFLGMVTNAAELIAEKAAWLRRFDAWVSRQRRWIIYLFTYLYFAFVPVSSDIFLTFLALADVKPREIWPYIFAGNLTFFLWLGYLVESGSPLAYRFFG
jgi:nitrate/nitrite transporter NarK